MLCDMLDSRLTLYVNDDFCGGARSSMNESSCRRCDIVNVLTFRPKTDVQRTNCSSMLILRHRDTHSRWLGPFFYIVYCVVCLS